MIQYQNRSKQIVVFNIPCQPGCEGEGCFCTVVKTALDEEVEMGGIPIKGTRVVERRLPGSITILGGQKSEELPDWVAETRVVKAALSRGTIRLVKQ